MENKNIYRFFRQRTSIHIWKISKNTFRKSICEKTALNFSKLRIFLFGFQSPSFFAGFHRTNPIYAPSVFIRSQIDSFSLVRQSDGNSLVNNGTLGGKPKKFAGRRILANESHVFDFQIPAIILIIHLFGKIYPPRSLLLNFNLVKYTLYAT